MIPTIKHSEKSKTMETVDVWGLGRRRDKLVEHRISRAMKLLYMIPKSCLHVIMKLSKLIECSTAKMNPNIKNGLPVIMMCQK